MDNSRIYLQGKEVTTPYYLNEVKKELTKYVDDKVEKDAIILEVYVPDRTNVTLNTQENRDKLNIWFNDILNKGYYRPLYIKSNATSGNLKEGFLSNRHLYRVLMASGFPLEGKPSEFKFYCLPTFNSISVSVLYGVQYRSTEQLETRAILRWNNDGSLSEVASVEWTGSKVYLPINTGTSGSSSKHLPLGVGNTTAYTPTGDYNPATKKYVDDSITTAIAGVSQFSLLPVDTLPTEDIKTNVIYAVPSDNPKEQDVRIEYVYINDAWEILGTTKIDLSNYYTKAEIDAMFASISDYTPVASAEEAANILNGTTEGSE